MRTLLRPLLAVAAATAVLLPGATIAAEQDDAPAGAAFPPAAQPASTPVAVRWPGASVVDDRELARQRGGADLHVNENNARAIVRDNVAANLSTGNNSINGESFSGMSGIPMVVQNSGNNVVIQNSTILNLQLK